MPAPPGMAGIAGSRDCVVVLQLFGVEGSRDVVVTLSPTGVWPGMAGIAGSRDCVVGELEREEVNLLAREADL